MVYRSKMLKRVWFTRVISSPTIKRPSKSAAPLLSPSNDAEPKPRHLSHQPDLQDLEGLISSSSIHGHHTFTVAVRTWEARQLLLETSRQHLLSTYVIATLCNKRLWNDPIPCVKATLLERHSLWIPIITIPPHILVWWCLYTTTY